VATEVTPSVVAGSGVLYLTSSAVTTQAQTDATAAYGTAVAAPCSDNLTGEDLGGKTLSAGVYCFSAAAGLTGTLTLSGGPTDVFIFQINSTLITGTNSNVSLAGSTVSACNVFWQVGSSATIQVNNNFVGNILAHTSITLNGGALLGRALANTGAVTISGEETVVSGCAPAPPSIVLSPATSSSICGSGATPTETATLLSNGSPLIGTSVTFRISQFSNFSTFTTSAPVLTGVLGTASFLAPALALLSTPDYIDAQFTDSTPTTWTSNTTTVSCVAPAVHDTTQPTVAVVNVIPGPPVQVVLSLQDTGSGLGTVIVTTSTNATTLVAPFVSGTTDTVGVTATKINQTESSIIELTVTDVAGNVTVFDPVAATITISASRSHTRELAFNHRQVASFGGIARTEGTVLIHNGTPGVERLVFSVNGRQFQTSLSDGQSAKLDISSALFFGTNTVRVTAFGDPNSSADLLISDSE
jgi:type VI secretion system secreted protein VgrG